MAEHGAFGVVVWRTAGEVATDNGTVHGWYRTRGEAADTAVRLHGQGAAKAVVVRVTGLVHGGPVGGPRP